MQTTTTTDERGTPAGAGAPAGRPAVLIVLMGSLGDIVRALPVVNALRHARPEARISWAVDARWAELVAAHPAVDRCVVFPGARTPGAIAGFLRHLRAERYDIALDLQRILKSGVCALASGAGRRIGFDRANAKEGNALFNNEHIPHRPPHVSKLRHYLAFAEHLHVPVVEPLRFGLDALKDPARRPSAVRELDGAFVAVVTGSSWPTKDWTADGYRDLSRAIVGETSCRVVLVGDGSGRAASDAVSRIVPPDRLIDLAGRTSLVELAATLAAARAVVGPDSGPGHLAAALGVPSVTLFGPTEVERVVPYRCEHLAVRAPIACVGCPRRRCRRRKGSCMASITAPMVWSSLKPLLV